MSHGLLADTSGADGPDAADADADGMPEPPPTRDGLLASSDAADVDADGMPEPPPTRGRCISTAVALAAITLAVSLVVVARGGDLGVYFGRLSRALPGGWPPASIGFPAWRKELRLLREDGQARHRKDENESAERQLLVFDRVASEAAARYWQVPSDTFPQTLAYPRDAAQATDGLDQCQMIAGTARKFTDGSQWIKLDHGTGDQDRWVSLGKFKLQRAAFTTLPTPGQMCPERQGLFPIDSMNHCEMAALDMGISKKVLSTSDSTFPEGCVVLNHSTVLLNTNANDSRVLLNVNPNITQTVCSSLEPCILSTSTTTTETQTRTDGISLFCFVIAAARSYEPDLLRFARSRKTSVYGCEEHMTLTDSEIDVGTDDDPEMTTAIGSLKCEMGGWGSWSNAGVFVKGWKAVVEDGRFRKHDWILKSDADSVFFPDRLKGHVGWMMTHGYGLPSELVYLENYMPGYPVVGAIEVLSNAAMLAFEQRIDECERIAWGGEDAWFVGCMRLLGARGHMDGELLHHEKNYLGCHDGRIVTMHPYKNVWDYQRCFEEASR